MPDWKHVDEVVKQAETDLEDYVRTLDHGECLHLIDHVGRYLGHLAMCEPFMADSKVRRLVPTPAYALRLLAGRAARTRPSRPGGRAAYCHDDCSVWARFGAVIARIDQRVTDAQRDV